MSSTKIAEFVRTRASEVLQFVRSVWIFVAVAILIAMAIFIFSHLSWEFWSERTYEASGKITEIKLDGLKLFQQLGLFLLAIIGLCLAVWRSLTAHRQSQAALEQSRTALRQAEISESGQKFDRYARAAQMLDSDKLSVRQAGIYLLRELALSDREKYGALCVDLLASFIRNRNSEGLIQAKTKKEFTELATPADVSDALLCLSKATQSLDKEINLSSTVWVDANFENGHDFNKFDFGKIYLSKTHFYNSSLDGISSTYDLHP